MTEPPITAIGLDPDVLEAQSLKYGRRCFRVMALTSGRWAVFDCTFRLLGIAPDLAGTQPLMVVPEAIVAAALAEGHPVRRAGKAALDALDLEDLL